MKLYEEIFSELEQIQLFINCGKKLNIFFNFEIIVLNSWNEAQKNYTDPCWEDITGDAQGILTEFLSQKYPQKYFGKWNKTADEIRPTVEKIVVPQVDKLIKQENLDPFLNKCVRWDLIHAVMVMIYEREKCKPPLFFKHLFEIYKSGHIPCGWEGSWPDGGKIKIF